MPSVVQLESVEKTYRMGDVDVRALRSVSLDLERGEMVAIMGASGSGKSTTLNVIGTLDRPTGGTYLLEGEPVESLAEDDLAELRNRKIGFVFQSFHLLPRLTAVDNVELPMVYAGLSRRERRDRARAALARVGLSEREDHLPNQLSGGQQQRVAIARALVTRPELVFADEPTGNLDSRTGREVLQVLQAATRSYGQSIAMVTHDPVAASYADRVVFLADGRVVSDRARMEASEIASFMLAIEQVA